MITAWASRATDSGERTWPYGSDPVPTGQNDDLTSNRVVINHFGQGLGLGATVPARTAVANAMPSPDHVYAHGVAIFGDSGSGDQCRRESTRGSRHHRGTCWRHLRQRVRRTDGPGAAGAARTTATPAHPDAANGATAVTAVASARPDRRGADVVLMDPTAISRPSTAAASQPLSPRRRRPRP